MHIVHTMCKDMHTVEYYAALTKEGSSDTCSTRLDLEDVALCEISQHKGVKLCDSTYSKCIEEANS